MIDLHNHLLPGLDDGAADMDEALAMAELAVADGITHMMCTPHIRPGRYDNDVPGIQAALEEYRRALDQAGIPLAVAAAAEMHFDLQLLERVENDTLPMLGHWKGQPVVLLEFPHSYLPAGAERLTEWLLARGITPLIAHPERNRDLVADPGRLGPFLDQGCLTQITASALLGQFGERAQAVGEALIDAGDATCIASDAHNAGNRPPGLSVVTAAVTERVGPERARALTRDNPWRIVAGHFTD